MAQQTDWFAANAPKPAQTPQTTDWFAANAPQAAQQPAPDQGESTLTSVALAVPRMIKNTVLHPVENASNILGTVGGIAGGMAGSILPGAGTAAGAMGGAALGGAAGEGLRELYDRITGDTKHLEGINGPGDVALNMAGQGALQGVTEGAGQLVGKLAVPALGKISDEAKNVMRYIEANPQLGFKPSQFADSPIANVINGVGTAADRLTTGGRYISNKEDAVAKAALPKLKMETGQQAGQIIRENMGKAKAIGDELYKPVNEVKTTADFEIPQPPVTPDRMLPEGRGAEFGPQQGRFVAGPAGVAETGQKYPVLTRTGGLNNPFAEDGTLTLNEIGQRIHRDPQLAAQYGLGPKLVGTDDAQATFDAIKNIIDQTTSGGPNPFNVKPDFPHLSNVYDAFKRPGSEAGLVREGSIKPEGPPIYSPAEDPRALPGSRPIPGAKEIELGNPADSLGFTKVVERQLGLVNPQPLKDFVGQMEGRLGMLSPGLKSRMQNLPQVLDPSELKTLKTQIGAELFQNPRMFGPDELQGLKAQLYGIGSDLEKQSATERGVLPELEQAQKWYQMRQQMFGDKSGGKMSDVKSFMRTAPEKRTDMLLDAGKNPSRVGNLDSAIQGLAPSNPKGEMFLQDRDALKAVVDHIVKHDRANNIPAWANIGQELGLAGLTGPAGVIGDIVGGGAISKLTRSNAANKLVTSDAFQKMLGKGVGPMSARNALITRMLMHNALNTDGS